MKDGQESSIIILTGNTHTHTLNSAFIVSWHVSSPPLFSLSYISLQFDVCFIKLYPHSWMWRVAQVLTLKKVFLSAFEFKGTSVWKETHGCGFKDHCVVLHILYIQFLDSFAIISFPFQNIYFAKLCDNSEKMFPVVHLRKQRFAADQQQLNSHYWISWKRPPPFKWENLPD